MIPMIPVSKNAVANRRLYLTNRAELIDFSDGDVLSRISLNEGLDGAEICALPQDLVSRGTNALRLHAASLPDGSAARSSASFTSSTICASCKSCCRSAAISEACVLPEEITRAS